MSFSVYSRLHITPSSVSSKAESPQVSVFRLPSDSTVCFNAFDLLCERGLGILKLDQHAF
jgi:hypothetical protein